MVNPKHRVEANLGRVACLAILLVIFVPAAQLSAQDSESRDLKLPPLSESGEFRYARALFPADADPADATAVFEMAPDDQDNLQRTLADRLSGLVKVYRNNRAAILDVLQVENIEIPTSPTSDRSFELEVVDGPEAVAAAGNDGRIVISALTLRGFLVGAVRSSTNENTSEGLMFRLWSGWSRDITGDDATWAKRVSALLDAGERQQLVTVPYSIQQNTFAAMLNELEEPVSPSFFDSMIERVLVRGESLTVSDTYRLNGALMFLTISIHGPEENFLLAHELGHLVLRHSYSTDCARSAQQEIDADAFAVTLLSYDFSGGVLDLALYGQPDDSAGKETYFGEEGTDLRRAKFGYVQAFRYGMANAGMRGDPRQICPFVSGEDRITRTDAFQKSIAQRRFAAFASVSRYIQAKPAVVASEESDDLLDARVKFELIDKVQAKCKGAPVRLVHYARQPTPDQKAHIYFAKCGWPPPSLSEVSEQDRKLIGDENYSFFVAGYSDAGMVDSESNLEPAKK